MDPRARCALALRSRPETPLPDVASARRPLPMTDKSITRACPRDVAVRLCCARRRAVTPSALRQAALCQSPPDPKTRLATPPRCCRPALHRRERPVVSDACVRLPEQAPPEGGCGSRGLGGREILTRREAEWSDPRRGRRGRPGILRAVRTSEEARFEVAETTSAHPPTLQLRPAGRPPEPRSERPHGRRRAVLLDIGLGNPLPGPVPPGPSWREPGSSPPPRRSPG